MTRYEGLPCQYCGEKFKNDDDVVVCPYCGAPYHRECYQKMGKCKYSDKHKDNFEWTIPIEELPPEKITICLKCKTPNPKSNTFCSNCHARLTDNVRVVSVIKTEGGDDNDLSPEGEVLRFDDQLISSEEIEAYTGKKSFYFLQRFRYMASGQKKNFWNWPAFLFRFLYFFYRKMYLVGIIALGLYAMIAIPSVMFSVELVKMNSLELFGTAIPYNAELISTLEGFMPTINILNIVYSFCCGFFANRLFMKKVFKDINIVRDKVKGRMNKQQFMETVRRIGKPDRLTVFLIIFGFLMLYFKLSSNLASLLI